MAHRKRFLKNIMPWPKISVITPSFNQGKFIEKTIRSVLEQNYPNLEYIVIDGGSNDNTLEVLKKYDEQIEWVSEPDNGQTEAINKGLRRSTGQILSYLNSDDTHQPQTLKVVADYFINNPESKFVFGRGRLIDAQDQEIGFYADAPTNSTVLARHCTISQPTAFWRREVYDEIGEFDECYQFSMDYEYWIRVAKKYDLDYLSDKILANTRIHQEAKTKAFTHKLHKDAVRAVRQHYGYVHQDWINTYVDSLISPPLKTDSPLYSLIMSILYSWFNLRWNILP